MRVVKRKVWERAQTGHLETWVDFARERRARTEERAPVWRAILKEVEAQRPFRSGERVLDIGCGLDTVLDYIPDVFGVTIDSLMAPLAELGLSEVAQHAAGAFEELPFRDASFDRVFLMNVLDHVRKPDAGLAEVARVLRAGGVLVLSVDTFAGRRYREKRLHKWWARVRGARTKHPWVFSIPDIQRQLERAGFEPGRPGHVPGTKDRRTFFTSERYPAPAHGSPSRP